LSDTDGVKAALSEQGARRAGRDYRLEPVAPESGYFHPKLSVFEAADDCHLLVGSGNLTFGGWGANLETVEHLHPSFAPEAFDDAAEFFQLLALDETLRMEARELCNQTGEALARVPRGEKRGSIRLLHNFGGGISSELRRYATELGGAQRLVVVAPFFDQNGAALSQLGADLQLDEIFVHAHPSGAVRGSLGLNWPVNAGVTIRPVCVESLGADTRHLHAKCFEILCARGRLTISGSANATLAALSSGKNVEVSVLRIDRDPQTSWILLPASAPDDSIVAADRDDDESSESGVLRAELNGERLEGLVLRPRLAGEAEVSVVTQRGTTRLGHTTIDQSGHFELAAPGLEMDSWSAGRLVVQITQGERVALGFLTLGIAFELARRAGPIGARMAALLSGSDTPEDLAAVFGWLAEDPTRVPLAAQAAGHSSEESSAADVAGRVTAADLSGPIEASPADRRRGSESARAWERLYDMLRAAFRKARGPFDTGELEDEDPASRALRVAQRSRSTRSVMRSFPLLLEGMLNPKNEGRFSLIALDMANYVCDRFEVERSVASGWLQRCLFNVPQTVSDEDKPLVAAAALLYFGAQGTSDNAQSARRYLLRRSLLGDVPSIPSECLPGFTDSLTQQFDLEAFRVEVLSHLTPGEEVANYRRALDGQSAAEGFDSLKLRPQWPSLLKALRDPARRSRIVFTPTAESRCPCCPMALPTGEISDLRQFGVATAANCCGRTILCEGQ
jgi:hypothetical protein